MRIRAAVLAAGVIAVLGACADGGGNAPPPDAIRVADDHYMVPIGADGGGCEQYTPWSARGRVTTAIYYRKADGSFTLYRSEVECRGG